MMAPENDSTLERVKDVHRRFPTGVTIVTTLTDGQPYGLAVNAFSSVSIDPPVVLVCVAKTSSTYEHLYRNDSLAVNILASDQLPIAARFATSGGEKFLGLEWEHAENGSPILLGACGFLELTVERRVIAYTHTIFIGRVVRAEVSDRHPLMYLGGKFFDIQSVEPLT